jgi:hypothetical protein
MTSMAKGPGKRAHTSCPADANALFDTKEQSSALSSDIATALPGSDEKVLDFPRVEVTPEESARRVMVEATRLASLAPGECGCGLTAALNASAYRVPPCKT